MDNKIKEETQPMEVKENKPAAPVIENAEDDYVLHFTKPYTFEGKEYKEIDLSGMDKITLADMSAIENRIRTGSFGKNTNFMIELTLEYACHFAAKVTELPVEFFLGIPATDAMELKGIIRGFLL